MSFAVDADAYDRFMGRYSAPLATAFCRFVGVGPGQHVLDVGCGPGALVAELVQRVGEGTVAAVEPSETFVAAARARFPGLDVRSGAAESLPFPDHTFDAACTQLVVHFMADPAVGIREMARVTRPGGVVAACVWDFEGGRAPISVFWRAAAELDDGVAGEADLAGARGGDLTRLLGAAGLRDVEEADLTITAAHRTFEEWWEPFTLGVGPAGAYAATLDPVDLAAIRHRCRQILGDGPFTIAAAAWAARGIAPSA
ncbi:MAG TPA: methyltransferase domain-containing protein [Actinomycetota bacterium]